MHDLAGGKSPEEVLRFVGDVQFPVKKGELVRVMRRNGAPDEVVATVAALPQTDIASQDDLLRLYPHLQ